MPAKRPRFLITRGGWVLLAVASAIFAASLIHRVNLLLLLFSLIIAAGFVGSLIGRRQILGLRVSRSSPTLLPLGRPLNCLVEITNTTKSPCVGLVIRDQVNSRFVLLPEPSRLSMVGPGQTGRIWYELTFLRRGLYRLGPIRLSSAYPFGFVRWTLDAEGTKQRDEIVVHPPIGRLSIETQQRLGRSATGEGRGSASLREGIDEFRGVREFRDGDHPKLIHWRSTARRGALVVRELEPAASRNLLVMVYLVQTPGTVERHRLEEVLSFAASIVIEVCKDPTLQLTMVIVGEHPAVVRGAATSARSGAYLRLLASAEATRRDSALDDACRLLHPSDTRERRLWVVSLAGISEDSQNRLQESGFRRVSTRTVLNASAGDLGRLWTPPDQFNAASPDVHAENAARNGLISNKAPTI